MRALTCIFVALLLLSCTEYREFSMNAQELQALVLASPKLDATAYGEPAKTLAGFDTSNPYKKGLFRNEKTMNELLKFTEEQDRETVDFSTEMVLWYVGTNTTLLNVSKTDLHLLVEVQNTNIEGTQNTQNLYMWRVPKSEHESLFIEYETNITQSS